MNKKIYNGYELIKAISDGEIKNRTRFRIDEGKRIIEYNLGTLYYLDNAFDEISSSIIIGCIFELIEENTIDIQSIEEIQTEAIGNLANEMKDKFNKILQWAKQHDKEIKSIKEK